MLNKEQGNRESMVMIIYHGEQEKRVTPAMGGGCGMLCVFKCTRNKHRAAVLWA